MGGGWVDAVLVLIQHFTSGDLRLLVLSLNSIVAESNGTANIMKMKAERKHEGSVDEL